MSWQFSDGVLSVQKVGGCWLHVTWQNQSKQTFPHLVRSVKRLEQAARRQGAKGLLMDTAKDNTHVQDMLRRGGGQVYFEDEKIVCFKKEVK